MSKLAGVRTLRNSLVNGSAHPLAALSGIGIALWMGGVQAAEPDVEYIMKIDKVIVEPTKVQQGKTSVIRCQWSAVFKSKAQKGYYEVKTNAPGDGKIDIKIQKTGAYVHLQEFHHIVKPGYYTPDALPKGEFKWKWTPSVAGPALISCSVHNHWEPWQTAKVEKLLPVDVALPTYHKNDSLPQAAANIALPPPKLEILSATATLTGNCNASPSPFLVAKLNIGNSGKAVPPNRGIARIRGIFGKYPDSVIFSNGDANLPGIKSGTTVVELPVGVKFPHKSKLSILSGTTRMFSVTLLPKTSGAFAQVTGFTFPVSFPTGVCVATLSSPAAPMMPTPSLPTTPAQGSAGSPSSPTTAPRLPAIQKPRADPDSPSPPQRPGAARQ